jgi:lipopolysaccharide transport system permease protein
MSNPTPSTNPSMRGILQTLLQVWRYRGFVLGSVKREFQAKYHQSLLGMLWTLIQPLAMILVYTLIFSKVMKTKLPGLESDFGYSIYLCAGLLTWGLFSEMISKSQTLFIDNANVLKKVNFPSATLPLILMLNALVNFGIIFGLFLAFLLVSGQWPGWVFWAILPVLALQLLLTMGLGLVLGMLNVFFRDVGQFFAVFLQFWFWLTPIVYPANVLPAEIQSYLALNPMYGIISAYQQILVQQQVPNFSSLAWPLVFGLVVCGLGAMLFSRHAGDMVDEL